MNPIRLMATTAFIAVAMTAGLAVAASPTLDTVKKRGQLVCGVNTGLAGFSAPDDKGVWRGFDVDFCRAVSAAIFGDPDKVTYKPLTGKTRFPADEAPGISVFCKNSDGEVFHTYSCYASGLDMLNGAYHYMDLAPKGRDEDNLEWTMAWLRRSDQYLD